MSAPGNPKDVAAQTEDKVRLDLLEPPADDAIARVLAHGADKYGLQNYRTIPIHYRTYIAATRRHLKALLRGEDNDPDSGESHWAHVGANVHVILAAMEEGTVVDDRGPAPRSDEQEARSAAANQSGGEKHADAR